MIEFGDYFGFSVSHTTRQPRPGKSLTVCKPVAMFIPEVVF